MTDLYPQPYGPIPAGEGHYQRQERQALADRIGQWAVQLKIAQGFTTIPGLDKIIAEMGAAVRELRS